MDEDERFVRLNVDDDYEGGQWIGGEFFYRSKRQKTAQTKDQKILGVFAAEDSSDEDRKGGRSSRKKEKMNYSKPVNFVSTGKVSPPPKYLHRRFNQRSTRSHLLCIGLDDWLGLVLLIFPALEICRVNFMEQMV